MKPGSDRQKEILFKRFDRVLTLSLQADVDDPHKIIKPVR
jgi:hypothetical protein